MGGTKKAVFNAELSTPFPGAGNDRTLRLFGFFDVGNVFGLDAQGTLYGTLSAVDDRFGEAQNVNVLEGYEKLDLGVILRLNEAFIVQLAGDNAGVNLGVASGTVMGPRRHLTASFTVLLMGMPATKLTSMTIQNSAKSECICPRWPGSGSSRGRRRPRGPAQGRTGP